MRARLAAAAAAATVVGIVGIAFWLVPASVHIVDWPPSGPVRVALLAPLSRLWLAAAVSAGVLIAAAAWWTRSGRPLDDLARRFAPLPWLLLLLVPYLPWIPDRAPALLALAGPVRWGIRALAIGATTKRLFLDGWQLSIGMSRPGIFVLSLAVYVAFGLQFASDAGSTGDEPHYLVIVHSLLVDRDLDIANNHAQRDYRAFFGAELRPDFLRRGRHGEIYSIHAPGLPALLLPAYAIGGAEAAIVMIALLGALAALAIFDAAAIITGRVTATLVWASVCLSVPFIPHAWLIYPELCAALIVAWAVVWWLQPETSAVRVVLQGVALGFLPWLHTKFVVLVPMLAVVYAIRLWPRARLVAALVVPIAVLGGLWLASFYWMYGVFDPQAPYGLSTRTTVLVGNIPRGVLGVLVDPKFGVITYSPIYLAAAAGAWFMARDGQLRWIAASLGATIAVFLVGTMRFLMWWGGTSAPGRFLVPVVPLIAPMIAVAVDRLRARTGRTLVWTAAVASVAVAIVGVVSPRQELLFSDPHGLSRMLQALEGPAPLDLQWPTFTEPIWPWVPRTAAAHGVAARRGSVSLLRAYDPSRLRAVRINNLERLADDETLSSARIVLATADDRVELPEGRFEARVWFSGSPSSGDVVVSAGEGADIARAPAASGSPVVLPFSLKLSSLIRIHAAGLISRAEISSVSVVPQSHRLPFTAHQMDVIPEIPQSYLAYVDDRTYPENGVFWTKGREGATVVVVTAGATRLRLVLHVGPVDTPVSLVVGGQAIDVSLRANETRDIDVPLSPGTQRVVVSARAARAFRPSDADPQSDDRRSLGVQIRPLVS